MKQFLIRYRRTAGAEADWHETVRGFVTHIESDPDLKGRIGYRVMRVGGGDEYLHIATPADEAAVKLLQSRPFFKAYNDETRRIAGGEVTVTPIEVVAETRA